MIRPVFTCLLFFSFFAAAGQTTADDLNFKTIPTRWDEAIPLGNGWLGALIWQKKDRLRLSLDRVDLWDDRPMPEIDGFNFNWVKQQVIKKDYIPVQKIGDEPYERYPAPCKIPGAAIEFNLQQLGKVLDVHLNIKTAINTITFDSGIKFYTYVHATKKAGVFYFEGITNQQIVPELIPPGYQYDNTVKADDMSGSSLTRLNYQEGTLMKLPEKLIYHQPTYDNNYYEVLVQWKKRGNRLEGSWTISNGEPAKPFQYQNLLARHIAWWKNYWQKSAVHLPDRLLERQYRLEMYKFGCVVRSDSPPISLQSIWTADNGSLPPWKGDFHFDLNVEMSYWPGYAANHLDLTSSLTNWLWKVKEENRKWTKRYFNAEGINVPGVTTISGKPMGGWIQYSMSPTTSAWMAHHFYQQWKYSMDNDFLQERCLPYLTEVTKYFKAMLVKDVTSDLYELPLSSSPEYRENSLEAWFKKTTNFDLSLIQNLYLRYAEVAQAAGISIQEIVGFQRKIKGLDYNRLGFSIAPDTPVSFSHRHLSHLMAIYPLAIINKTNPLERTIMENSMRNLEKQGTREWLGFSFTWAATLYAQLGQGDSAIVNLSKFAKNFCASNSFNLNGDQKGGQYSNYTYRPFTLETNFGFAEGIHQLLLQSEHGYIEIFPALPNYWKNVSFRDLRAQGAFLVSALRRNGINKQIRILSLKGGKCSIKSPFDKYQLSGITKAQITCDKNNIMSFQTHPGQVILIKCN